MWIADQRISAVASASIDRSTVDLDKGEMSFSLFDFSPGLDAIAVSELSSADKINQLGTALGDAAFPRYLREFILRSISSGRNRLKVDQSAGVFPSMSDQDKTNIERRQGFLTIRDAHRAGNTVHFLRVIRNDAGKARLFYKFDGSLQFIKSLK